MGEGTRTVRLTEADANFVVDTVAPGARNREKLKALLQEDESFRQAMAGDERLFHRIMSDEEALVRLSPALYFEVLFRQALKELEKASHTMERSGGQRVPVFDAREVVGLLSQEAVLDYLSGMLSSFTRIESYTIPVRVKPQVWRRVRFNDMDIDSLARMCASVGEESRFAFYKRIADVCLFMSGVFPEHAHHADQHQRGWLRARRGAQDYEEEGRRFYKLASEHLAARALVLSEVLLLLHEHFTTAWKPLNFISQHYLCNRRGRLFQMQTGGQQPPL